MLQCLLLLLLVASLLFPEPVQGLKRCDQYKREVRNAHFAEFGLEYPWWYGVAQLEEESACRSGSVSNDGVGSIGLSQVTWSFWGKHLKKVGIQDLSTAKNQIRAQAYIMRDAHRHKFYELWISYQIYNGGRLVLKEIARAGGDPCWSAAKSVAKRKDVVFSSGQRVNAADINYRYSQRIYKHGQRYRIGSEDARYPFWWKYEYQTYLGTTEQ